MELFTLSEEESVLCHKIWKLLEKHVVSECGEFDCSYALQNTNVTELTHKIIVNLRNQIEFSKQVKNYR